MFATKKKLVTTLGAGALVLGLAGQAFASINPAAQAAPNAGDIRILTGAAARFERGVVVSRYEAAFAAARKAGTAPRRDLTKQPGVATAVLRAATNRLKQRPAQPTFASPETYGVSQSTLDAIAACESGGDPTAVSPDGTYRGKYQFDYGTWASVGGSGDPAAASAAEQDLRAAMLYARAGSSPWPICG